MVDEETVTGRPVALACADAVASVEALACVVEPDVDAALTAGVTEWPAEERGPVEAGAVVRGATVVVLVACSEVLGSTPWVVRSLLVTLIGVVSPRATPEPTAKVDTITETTVTNVYTGRPGRRSATLFAEYRRRAL